MHKGIQALLREALEAEVAEFLGQVCYQRRATVDAPAGTRMGTSSCGG
ncbi:MAG: hypothetical protein QN185_04525 [Armatimonadota bacterium]|nr:hypothetical protein [Armatimonadota bacterium]